MVSLPIYILDDDTYSNISSNPSEIQTKPKIAVEIEGDEGYSVEDNAKALLTGALSPTPVHLEIRSLTVVSNRRGFRAEPHLL